MVGSFVTDFYMNQRQRLALKSIAGRRRRRDEADIGEVKTDNDVFITWRVIAAALGVRERAARYYEDKLDLPVRRQGGLVYLTGRDLKKWRGKTVIRRYNERRAEIIADIDAGNLIITWPDIGRALGISARTARRYRDNLGLPVFKQGTRVMLDKTDLHKWRTAEAQRHFKIRNEQRQKRKGARK